MLTRRGLSYVLCIFFIESTKAAYKRWLPNTDFNNPNNWNLKRTPCGNDVIILPDESPAVYVQLNTTIKELVLPMNGELILGKNTAVGFTDQAVAGCPAAEGDLEFTAVHPESWLNPASWCQTATETGPCDVTRSPLSVEIVPCYYDDAIFAREHSFFVDLSAGTRGLAARTVKIAGTSMTGTSFADFLNRQDQRMFRVPVDSNRANLINITRKRCDDPGGCACGNDKPEIVAAICQFVTKSCPRAKCSQSIKPVGSCCKMCGAMFNITRGEGFSLSTFTFTLKSIFYPGGSPDGVNITFSVTSEGWLQMILTDETGDRSVALAQKIAADFMADLDQGGHKYAIDDYRIYPPAFFPVQPSHSKQQDQEMSGGSVAGIIIAVVALLLAVVLLLLIFAFKRAGRQIPMPSMPTLPSFRSRLPWATGPATQRVMSQPRTTANIDPGFANPLYDGAPLDDKMFAMKEMELIMSSADQQPTFDVSDRGFQNPLFGTTGTPMFSDPAAVGDSLDVDKKEGAAICPDVLSIDHPTTGSQGVSTI